MQVNIIAICLSHVCVICFNDSIIVSLLVRFVRELGTVIFQDDLKMKPEVKNMWLLLVDIVRTSTASKISRGDISTLRDRITLFQLEVEQLYTVRGNVNVHVTKLTRTPHKTILGHLTGVFGEFS